MGKTAKDVMTKAISYLNTKEIPANSNNVIFNTHYYGKAVSGSAYPWCCAYVWDIFRLAGASNLFYGGKKTAYCPTVETWGKSNKLTVNKSKGKYGDIVLFDFDGEGESGHIGFIVQKNSDGTYKTIEGNTAVGNDSNGGCVMYRTRSQSSIRCIIRPKYDSEKKNNQKKDKKTTKSKTESSKYTYKQFVKDIQKAIGAKVDGIAGKETYSKCPTISKSKNNKHAVVRPLQKYLNATGYPCGTADGIAGEKFDTAAKAWAKANGCIADGEFTKKGKSWKKILKLI